MGRSDLRDHRSYDRVRPNSLDSDEASRIYPARTISASSVSSNSTTSSRCKASSRGNGSHHHVPYRPSNSRSSYPPHGHHAGAAASSISAPLEHNSRRGEAPRHVDNEQGVGAAYESPMQHQVHNHTRHFLSVLSTKSGTRADPRIAGLVTPQKEPKRRPSSSSIGSARSGRSALSTRSHRTVEERIASAALGQSRVDHEEPDGAPASPRVGPFRSQRGSSHRIEAAVPGPPPYGSASPPYAPPQWRQVILEQGRERRSRLQEHRLSGGSRSASGRGAEEPPVALRQFQNDPPRPDISWTKAVRSLRSRASRGSSGRGHHPRDKEDFDFVDDFGEHSISNEAFLQFREESYPTEEYLNGAMMILQAHIRRWLVQQRIHRAIEVEQRVLDDEDDEDEVVSVVRYSDFDGSLRLGEDGAGADQAYQVLAEEAREAIVQLEQGRRRPAQKLLLGLLLEAERTAEEALQASGGHPAALGEDEAEYVQLAHETRDAIERLDQGRRRAAVRLLLGLLIEAEKGTGETGAADVLDEQALKALEDEDADADEEPIVFLDEDEDLEDGDDQAAAAVQPTTRQAMSLKAKYDHAVNCIVSGVEIEELEQTTAAVVLQCFFRRILAEQHALDLIMMQLEVAEAAATIIQCLVRRKLAETAALNLLIDKLEESAIVIQCLFRRRVAEQEAMQRLLERLELREDAALVLQCFGRRILAEARLLCLLQEQDLREETAAVTLQYYTRRLLAGHSLRGRTQSRRAVAALILERAGRGLLGRRAADRRRAASTTVQCAARSWHLARRVAQRRRAAVLVQALLRSFLAQRRVLHLLDQALQEDAAVTLQCLFRRRAAEQRLVDLLQDKEIGDSVGVGQDFLQTIKDGQAAQQQQQGEEEEGRGGEEVGGGLPPPPPLPPRPGAAAAEEEGAASSGVEAPASPSGGGDDGWEDVQVMSPQQPSPKRRAWSEVAQHLGEADKQAFLASSQASLALEEDEETSNGSREEGPVSLGSLSYISVQSDEEADTPESGDGAEDVIDLPGGAGDYMEDGPGVRGNGLNLEDVDAELQQVRRGNMRRMSEASITQFPIPEEETINPPISIYEMKRRSSFAQTLDNKQGAAYERGSYAKLVDDDGEWYPCKITGRFYAGRTPDGDEDLEYSVEFFDGDVLDKVPGSHLLAMSEAEAELIRDEFAAEELALQQAAAKTVTRFIRKVAQVKSKGHTSFGSSGSDVGDWVKKQLQDLEVSFDRTDAEDILPDEWKSGHATSSHAVEPRSA